MDTMDRVQVHKSGKSFQLFPSIYELIPFVDRTEQMRQDTKQ